MRRNSTTSWCEALPASPQAVILAGISTNPPHRHVTAQQVYAAVRPVSGVEAGYWLNIPAGGRYCPRCGEPQPQVALQLLEMMSANGPR